MAPKKMNRNYKIMGENHEKQNSKTSTQKKSQTLFRSRI